MAIIGCQLVLVPYSHRKSFALKFTDRLFFATYQSPTNVVAVLWVRICKLIPCKGMTRELEKTCSHNHILEISMERYLCTECFFLICLYSLLRVEPAQRMTVIELLEHQWLNEGTVPDVPLDTPSIIAINQERT